MDFCIYHKSETFCVKNLCSKFLSKKNFVLYDCVSHDWGVYINFGLRAYAEFICCPLNAKLLNKRHCCCYIYSVHSRFIVCFVSILLVLFEIRFRSSDHSFDQSICPHHFVISSQTQLHSSITLHLLYIVLPASTVRLPHDFVFYRVVIVLPVEVAIDTLINKTPPTVLSQE